MGSRTWFKVYADRWMEGTIRQESPLLRSVWIDLMAMAACGKYGDTGEIKLWNGVGLGDQEFAAIVGVSRKTWTSLKQHLVKTERIEIEHGNVIRILNWAKYQSEYNRTKQYRIPEGDLPHAQRATPNATDNATPNATTSLRSNTTTREGRGESREKRRERGEVESREGELLTPSASFPLKNQGNESQTIRPTASKCEPCDLEYLGEKCPGCGREA